VADESLRRAEWRAHLDVDDERPVFCPECAEREFGVRVCRPSG
jgi:hypothetical protein